MTDIPNAPAEAEGALSVDAAVAELATRRTLDTPAEAAPAQAAPAEQTPSGDQPETTAGGAEKPADAEPAEQQEPAQPAVQAPQYWSKEAKAEFAKLPPELQAVVAEQEGGREKAKGRAAQEAAEARKAAETEAGAYRERSSRLGELLPQLEARVADRWKDVTPEVWAEIAQADPDKYVQLKAQHEADTAALTKAKDEAAQADADAHRKHLEGLVTDLPKVAPELADEREGPKRLQAVFGYLGEQGITPDQLKWVTAGHLGIAHKAMLYDQAQAAVKTAPKPEPKPAAPPLRPAAAASTPANAEATTATRRLAQTGRVDDAVAVLRARRKTG